MRSRCRRSIMTMSASASPSRMSRATSTPKRSIPVEKCGRRDDAHACAHGVEQDDVPARDARMQYVAADRHQQAVDAAFVATDRECVEQRLGRMFVRAVAGIDDRTVDFARAIRPRRTRGGVLNDIRCMAFNVIAVSMKCFALAHRGRAGRHVHHIGAKAFAGQFDAGRERVKLQEDRSGRPRAMPALFLDLAIEVDEFLGDTDRRQISWLKALYPQQMPPAEDERGFRGNGH